MRRKGRGRIRRGTLIHSAPAAPHTSVAVLSLGAGVQSSALLLMADREPDRIAAALERPGFRIDVAVFADTGDEPASVYSWLWRLVGAVSIPVIIGSRGHLSADQLSGRSGVGRSPWFLAKENGAKPGRLPRQCTRDYKVRVVHDALRRWLGYRPRTRFRHTVVKVIGFSYDEVYRIKPSPESWETNMFPLVEMRWRREDAIRYVIDTGLGTPPRSACVMCPYHNDAEWLRLQTDEPDGFARAVEFERALHVRKGQLVTSGPPLRGVPYLHRSCEPLGSIDFAARVAADPKRAQLKLFHEVCGADCNT